jgi:hypothetical protein
MRSWVLLIPPEPGRSRAVQGGPGRSRAVQGGPGRSRAVRSLVTARRPRNSFKANSVKYRRRSLSARVVMRHPLSRLKYNVQYTSLGKAVPLHAMEALGGRGCIVPTHSRLRH